MKIIQEIRILIEVQGENIFDESYKFLKENLSKAIDWEQGDCYPEEESPLQ